MSSGSFEDYLKVIYYLNLQKITAKTTSIATYLQVNPASVTEMLKKLKDKGFIKYKPYDGATLTVQGRKIAKQVCRKHGLVELFLHERLGIEKKRAHKEAHRLEHVISPVVEQAICRDLKHPEKAPDEEDIPPCDIPITSCVECLEQPLQNQLPSRKKPLIPLTEFKEGEEGVVAFIRGGKRVIKRLSDLGLTPNTKIKVVNTAPLNGPVEIEVRSTNLAIGRGIAKKIFIVKI